MEVGLVGSSRNVDRPITGLAFSRLIVLSKAFSDISGPKAHHRVRSRIVVRGPSEYFHPDDAFAKRFFRPGKAMLNHEAKHILALPAGSKRGAAKDVVYQLLNLRASRRRL